MENNSRRWFSLINIPVQFRILFLIVGAIFSTSILLGSFIYLTIQIMAFLPLSSVNQIVVNKIMWIYGLSVFGTIMVGSAMFCLVALRETNRIVGPIYRIKEELRKMHKTGNIETISVREQDHFQEMVKYLNLVLVEEKQSED